MRRLTQTTRGSMAQRMEAEVRRSFSKVITHACVFSLLMAGMAGHASVAHGQAKAPAAKPAPATPKAVPAKPLPPKPDTKTDPPEPTREERTEKAKVLLEQGEAKMSEGDYPAALELFRGSNASRRSTRLPPAARPRTRSTASWASPRPTR
jgi:hypothetical protein